MRGIRAKRIRRDIFGDSSPRVRRYKWQTRVLSGRLVRTGAVICDGLRAKYQKAKKQRRA